MADKELVGCMFSNYLSCRDWPWTWLPLDRNVFGNIHRDGHNV